MCSFTTEIRKSFFNFAAKITIMKINIISNLALLALFVWNCANNSNEKPSASTTTLTTEEQNRLEKEHEPFRAGYADSVNLGLIEDNTFKSSSRRIVTAEVGGAKVMVNYGSPGKRGRVIWNGLVSYDQVWVTGAHWATAIEFSKDVKINGITVPAGMYGFFTIPNPNEWTLIINKRYDQHLADDYSDAEDVVRVKVKPENLTDLVQRLTYTITPSGNKGTIGVAWDNVKVSLPFEVI
jgi:hypothetical protein